VQDAPLQTLSGYESVWSNKGQNGGATAFGVSSADDPMWTEVALAAACGTWTVAVLVLLEANASADARLSRRLREQDGISSDVVGTIVTVATRCLPVLDVHPHGVVTSTEHEVGDGPRSAYTIGLVRPRYYRWHRVVAAAAQHALS
jgi:hypothetical protein